LYVKDLVDITTSDEDEDEDDMSNYTSIQEQLAVEQHLSSLANSSTTLYNEFNTNPCTTKGDSVLCHPVDVQRSRFK